MGCCCSKKQRKYRAAALAEEKPSQATLPEIEEKVKEVLSETPAVKFKPTLKAKHVESVLDDGEGDGEARSELAPSETASESLSTISTAATGTVLGKDEIRRRLTATGKIRPTGRSFSGELARPQRAVAVAGVGCRSNRSSPSPGRSRSLNGGGGPRNDPGERSGRRSVSPAAKSRGVNPRRVPPPAARARRAMDDAMLPAPINDDFVDPGTSGGKESLDNPLVSLECFIFL